VHLSEDQLQRYLVRDLAEPGADEVKSHLEECGDCRFRLAEQLVTAGRTRFQQLYSGEERRQAPRRPVNCRASLQMLSPLVLERSEVQVLNVSRSGLMIRTSRPLSFGVIVQLRIQNRFIMGEVRYCLRNDEGVCAGIQIQDSVVAQCGCTTTQDSVLVPKVPGLISHTPLNNSVEVDSDSPIRLSRERAKVFANYGNTIVATGRCNGLAAGGGRVGRG
jgi:hypothetical protein